MKKVVYPAIFEEEELHFFVRFPDIPMAVTQGDTLEEAYEAAEDVLGLALEDQLDEELPVPSSMKQITEENANAIVALIGVDLFAYRKRLKAKTIRKSVTIPEWVDELATRQHVNFSATLTEALEDKLGV